MSRVRNNVLAFEIFSDITDSSFVCYSRDCSRATHVVTTKKFFRIFVSNGLVGHGKGIVRVNTTGEIQVDIRNLVTVEAQEYGKGDVVSVTNHVCSTMGTSFGRKVKAGIHFVVQEELTVFTLGTTIVRLQRINFRNVKHSRNNRTANTTTRANKVTAVKRMLNQFMSNEVQNGEAITNDGIKLHFQTVFYQLG